MTLEAEASGGERQHTAELPAAQNADGRVQSEHAENQSLGVVVIAAVWRARQASRRSASAGSASARTAQASRPALIAPALPMASVPTGTPGGICRIESSESLPSSVLVFMGTPNTGSDVSAAVIPGRCAAPPAPAITTLKPLWRADFANS